MSNQLKVIDFSQKKFVANGKEYFIEENLSYERWIMWRKLQVQIGYDITFDVLFSKIKEAYLYLNKPTPEPVSAGVILYNIMEGVKMISDDKQIPLVIRLCALFVNTKDEDRATITEAIIEEKKDDWVKEGISMNSFFALAISSIPSFLENYEVIIQNTSQQTESKRMDTVSQS